MSAPRRAGLVVALLLPVTLLVGLVGGAAAYRQSARGRDSLYQVLGRSTAILRQPPQLTHRGPHQLLHGTVKIPRRLPAIVAPITSPAAQMYPSPVAAGPVRLWVNAYWMQRWMEQSF